MPQQSLHILFVEDSTDNVAELARALRQEGLIFDHMHVENAKDMIWALNSQSWDIIISNYTLSNFTGLHALEIARSNVISIPFIVVSEPIGEEEVVRLMRLGATDYLPRNRVSRLGQAVRHAIDNNRLRTKHILTRPALCANRHWLDAFVMASSDLAYILDIAGNFVEVVSEKHPLLPEPAEQMIGKCIFDYFDHATATTLLKTLQQSAANRNKPVTVEYTTIINGTQYWFEGRAVCIEEHESDAQNLVAWISRDISASKQQPQADKERLLLQEQLKRERELRAIKSRFFAMLAHDIRNPLAVIKMLITTLQLYSDRLLPDQRNTKFARIHQQIDLIGMFIEDILIVERMESGTVEIQSEETDFVTFIINQTMEMQSLFGQTHRIALLTDVASAIVAIDHRLIQRAFMNLVSNAVKYSPKGSRIDIRLTADESSVVLSVTDEGLGIPEEDQKHLFETFNRGSNVGNISGTGLGLALVKEAVQLHHGSVGLTSKLGVGSTFRILLPCIKYSAL